MSDVLMDLIKGAVSKEIMGKMGGIIGQPAAKTESAFEKAAGAILGGLIKKTSSSQGANDVFKAVQGQDDGILDKLGDLLGGGQATNDFQKQGGGILDMVFGGSANGIMGTLAKALGMKGSIISTLMSMAAPIVMGVVGRYVKNKALDAVGLGKFFGSQKASLGNFMPASLTNDLGFGNLLGNVTGAAGDAVGAAGNAGRAAVGAAGDAVGAAGNAAGNAGRAAAGAAGDAANAGGNMLKALIPLILLGILGFLGYKYLLPALSGAADKAGDAVAAAGDAVGDAAGSVAGAAGDAASSVGGAITGGIPKMEMPSFDGINFPEGFDITGMKDQFSGITEGLGSVSMDNAGDLATKIKGLTGNLDNMGIGDLTGPAKDATSSMFGGFIKTLQGAMGGMDSGILGILKPVIEPLIEKLTGFMG